MWRLLSIIYILVFLSSCSSIDKSKRVYSDSEAKVTLEKIEVLFEDLAENNLSLAKLEKVLGMTFKKSEEDFLYFTSGDRFDAVARLSSDEGKDKSFLYQLKFKFIGKQGISLKDTEMVFGPTSVRREGGSFLLDVKGNRKAFKESVQLIIHTQNAPNEKDSPILSILARQRD